MIVTETVESSPWLQLDKSETKIQHKKRLFYTILKIIMEYFLFITGFMSRSLVYCLLVPMIPIKLIDRHLKTIISCFLILGQIFFVFVYLLHMPNLYKTIKW